MPSSYSFVQDYRKITETYEIRDDGLFFQKGEKKYLVRFPKIKHIRLRYFPGRIKTNQYEAQIKLETGQLLRLSSVTFVGFGNFKDQAKEYSAFVRALLEILEKENPNVELQFGHSTGRFLFGLISQILIFSILGIVLFTLPVGGGLIWVKILYIIFLLPYLVKYFIKNRPAGSDDDDLDRVLP